MEAAQKSVQQFIRYEAASKDAAIVCEGEDHPALSWLAAVGSSDWLSPVAEKEIYNSDFQVCIGLTALLLHKGTPGHAEHEMHAADLVRPWDPSFLCLQSIGFVDFAHLESGSQGRQTHAMMQVFADADTGSPPDSGRTSSQSNADSARLSQRCCASHSLLATP